MGYRITYYLDKFEYYRKTGEFNYQGNILFNEDSTINSTSKMLLEEKRKDAYLGSRMHFFRALWANELTSSGFRVENNSNETINYNSFVLNKPYLQGSDMVIKKVISYPAELIITYNETGGKSYMILLKPEIYFNETGYFDPGLNWRGEMIVKRIGDMLPYEYEYK